MDLLQRNSLEDDIRFVLPHGLLLDLELGGAHAFRADVAGRMVAIPALVESGAVASHDVGQRMRPR
jgi:hypothetical protein